MSTLAELRTRFYRRFDSGQAGYIGTAEANSLINEGARHLHNWVVSEAEYYIWKESVVPLVTGQSDYPLPLDFQKLLKVFVSSGQAISGASPNWFPIARMMPQEFRGLNRIGCGQAYMMMGQTLRIMPLPAANPGSIMLWYVPQYKDLVLDTDVSEVSNDPGWDEFIVNQAVIAARIKEESDTGALQDRQNQIMQMIQSSIINRDMGQRARIVDVDQQSMPY